MLKNKLPLLLLASPFLFASKCKDRKNKAITEDVVNVARPEFYPSGDGSGSL